MRWILKPIPEPHKINELKNALNVDSIVASLLLQRGIDTFEKAKSFFRPSLSELHNPYLMKDMEKAVVRIEKALKQHENILVYGDYDVDGTTAVALMASYLKTRTNKVATYIPDRYTEGYGISFTGIDFAHDNNFSLIIALDCGIKAVDKVNYANQKSIDVIICDHHLPGEIIPQAVAVLDPKQPDCNYPYKELCGCGVGFKLITALAEKNGQTITDLIPYLDLVATAIGADIVPITGENRILAYHGLEVINKNPRAGIKAIKAFVKKEHLTITDVVFIIAPRINAAGRMKHGNHAVTLLTETNADLAINYAKDINDYNLERREADQSITQDALSQIRENKEENCFTSVVYNEAWHKGVIGIVASRLTETYYRPTLVFTKSGNKLAASARSVTGFDVYNALEACAEYIEQYGGHKYAAGLTMLPENYSNFKAKFEIVVKETIDPQLLNPQLNIDLNISLNQITPKLQRIISQFAPFGPGNMTPVFMTENVIDTGWGKCVGKDDKHLRLTVTDYNEKEKISAIGFGLGTHLNITKNKQPFQIAYTIEETVWNGASSLQLKLKNLKP